ncbi:MAG: SDR family oxidoreductase [Rhizobiaceae bacterium]|nr:SDR family oxidoreductase [Rhizobiaceae bacterium]
MRVMIIGAAGMLGRKLAASLADDGSLGGRKIDSLILADVVKPNTVKFSGEVELLETDLSEPGKAEALVARRPDLIFHLAAIVSGEAEANFEKGYHVNLDGTRSLFEAIRKTAEMDSYTPKVVFTSSIVVYGEPLPECIDDDYVVAPLTSYGAQKAIGEILLADYSRRGFFDGIGIRLPTISIRPGKPNRAASGFFSSILREPLIGEPAILPVSDDVRHWFASPRAAVGFMLHAATLDTRALEARRTLTMPGVCATVGDQVDALRRAAGENATKLIRREYDPVIANIIAGWPRRFRAARAEQLGFKAEANFDEIIRVHLEDELAHVTSH